jgi:hypothetical protein
MMPAGTLVLAFADGPIFAPPRNQPARPAQPNRRIGGAGRARSLVRALRGRLTRALAPAHDPRMPRVSANYPY